MATQVKHRRGTNAEILAGTPAIGELWFNTTDNSIHMGDGVTPGGVKHMTVPSAEKRYTATFNTIADMIANADGVKYVVGMPLKVQGDGYLFTNYMVENIASDVDLGGGLWATELNSANLDTDAVLFPVVRQVDDKAIPASNISAGLRSDGARVNTVFIGDSFLDGVGAGVFNNRYGEVVDQMINYSSPKGYGTGTHANMIATVGVAGSGFTTTGNTTSNGALESQLRLLDGEVFEVTGYEVDFADIWYYAGTTTGDVNVYVNDVLQHSFVASKAGGVTTSFGTAVGLSTRTKSTDVIKFEATGGQVDITGFNPLRQSDGGNYTLRISHGGWSYKTYDNQAIVDEISAYGLFTNAPPMYVLQLGTNSIYNPTEAQTPTEMISSLVSFITKLATAAPSAGFIVCVPPQADENTWPVVKAGYTYEDYQTALIDYGSTNGVQLIRLDESGIARYGMTSDALHPSDAGHINLAKIFAKGLGLSETAYKGDITHNPQGGDALYADVIYNDVWGDFGNGLKYYEEGGRASLSGFAAKNGSASTTIGNIPASGFPQGRDPQFFCITDTGTTTVAIGNSTGDVVVTGTAVTTWVAIEITWVIDQV